MKTRIIYDGPQPTPISATPPETTLAADDSGPGRRRRGATFLGPVRSHPVLAFMVLTYALAWGAIPWNSFGAYSPLVSALLVVGITEGRPGLRRLGARVVRWRVAWWWYAVAIAVPVAMQLSAVGANVVAGAGAPSWTQITSWYSVFAVFGLSMINPTGGPLGEEPGWRGFAQTRLQGRHSPLVATAILGLVVACWHVPLMFMPAFDLGPIDWTTTVAVTFWYAWLYNRTGGSVLLTLVAHSAESVLNTSEMWTGADADRLPGFQAVAWWTFVVALLVLDRAAWRTAPPSAIERPGEDHRVRAAEPVLAAT
jgi:uncharacterized protein